MSFSVQSSGVFLIESSDAGVEGMLETIFGDAYTPEFLKFECRDEAVSAVNSDHSKNQGSLPSRAIKSSTTMLKHVDLSYIACSFDPDYLSDMRDIDLFMNTNMFGATENDDAPVPTMTHQSETAVPISKTLTRSRQTIDFDSISNFWATSQHPCRLHPTHAQELNVAIVTPPSTRQILDTSSLGSYDSLPVSPINVRGKRKTLFDDRPTFKKTRGY